MTHKTDNETTSTRYRVRLFGLTPEKEPCRPVDNWYTVTGRNDTVATVLDMFALGGDSLIVLKNGRHAGVQDVIEPEDEIIIFLKCYGG